MDAGRTPAPQVRPAIVAAALLLGQQVAGRATRDALFLSAFPVSALPLMTALAAATSLAATMGASRIAARLSPSRLVPLALAASALAFAAEWGLAVVAPRAAAVAVYLHHAVFGAVLVSGFWLLVTERFDPYTARQAMGAIGAGASLGGVAGGLLTWGAAHGLGASAMLGVLAALSVAGLVAVRALAGPQPGRAARPEREPPGARSASQVIRRAPLLRALAAVVIVTAFLDVVLDYVLAAAATDHFGDGPALLSFFAAFHSVTGLLALGAQVAMVGAMLTRLGPAWTVAVSSLATAAGAAAALFAPGLAAAVALRGGLAVLRNSAFRSGYELLYTPLPDPERRPAKVVVDVSCDRIGGIAGSAAVMLVLWLAGERTEVVLLALAGATAAAALALTPALRRGYVGALAGSLRATSSPPEASAVVDPSTLLTLASVSVHSLAPGVGGREGAVASAADPLVQAIADLRSGDTLRIVPVLMRPELDPRLVSHVVPLLARDTLFEAAAASLRRSAARCTGQLVDALLDPSADPATRRRVARVLRGVPTQRAADGLRQGLDDPRFDLRYRCALALLRVRRQNPQLELPAARVLDRAARDAAHAGQSARHLEHVFTLLAIVLDHPALDAAARALQSGDAGARGTALEYLDHVLPQAVRDPLWPHLGVASRPARSGRSEEEIREDLMRSTMMTRPPASSD
jgi:hypothetical protein